MSVLRTCNDQCVRLADRGTKDLDCGRRKWLQFWVKQRKMPQTGEYRNLHWRRSQARRGSAEG